MQPQFLPETDPAVLEHFAVDGPLAVRGILDDLVRERALIALYSPLDHEEFVVSQILGWTDAGIRFEFTTDESRRRALLAAGSVVVVAFLDRIKIQFATGRIRVSDEGGLSVLECELPRRVHRIQRRDAQRVRTPSTQPVECVIRAVDGVEHAYRVLDVSAGGVALMVPPERGVPALGELWQQCRLEIPGYPPIACDLAVRFVSEGLRGDAAACRVGCEFHRPLPQTRHAVQLYLTQVQRGRTTGPGRSPDG